MKVKEESEKVGLKLNIQKTKIMASGPITSWQTGGETMETVTDFIWGRGSKITADGDCSHEIKRYLLLGRKAMINLDSILNSKDITLPTKVHLKQGTKSCPTRDPMDCSLPGSSIHGIFQAGVLEWAAIAFSVAQSCLTLCHPVDYSTPGFPVHHQLPELTQTHAH